jgi:hypothetical protein
VSIRRFADQFVSVSGSFDGLGTEAELVLPPDLAPQQRWTIRISGQPRATFCFTPQVG